MHAAPPSIFGGKKVALPRKVRKKNRASDGVMSVIIIASALQIARDERGNVMSDARWTLCREFTVHSPWTRCKCYDMKHGTISLTSLFFRGHWVLWKSGREMITRGGGLMKLCLFVHLFWKKKKSTLFSHNVHRPKEVSAQYPLWNFWEWKGLSQKGEESCINCCSHPTSSHHFGEGCWFPGS